MRTRLRLSFLASILAASLAYAASAVADSSEVVIEIYRIAPGKHEEFLRQVALYDQANAEAGLAPRQLYVHSSGASWDFILIQPSDYTDEQNQKLSAAYKKLGVPGGGKFFLSIRQYLLEHSDTVADKTTAAEWLKQLQ
ncbi:MAG TPA: hypothetical protein VFR59_08675 [Steroidobacteraceae bacterium]|nr:hypothetical protein [Steroidobacteraceae bacterium]